MKRADEERAALEERWKPVIAGVETLLAARIPRCPRGHEIVKANVGGVCKNCSEAKELTMFCGNATLWYVPLAARQECPEWWLL